MIHLSDLELEKIAKRDGGQCYIVHGGGIYTFVCWCYGYEYPNFNIETILN